jgi:hypothetical protein
MPSANVGTMNKVRERAEKRWAVIHDLLSGSEAMRAGREKYLPREDAEKPKDYDRRINRSFLFPGLKDAIDLGVSKPFSRDIAPKPELTDDKLKAIFADCDRQGTTASEFFREVFADAIAYGISHVLIDFPSMTEQQSLATLNADLVRPYFVHIKARSVIGWRTRLGQAGEIILSEIRFRSSEIETDGFEEKEVETIVRYTEFVVETYRKNNNGEYALSGTVEHTFGAIPLATLYIGRRMGYMSVDPPYYDLAELNVQHWQSSSDQRNVLRMSRFAVFSATGITDDERKRIKIGPSVFVSSEKTDAKFSFVEHSGAAIAAGERDLKILEDQMQMLGTRPFVERTSRSTATGKMIDTSASDTDIQTWVRILEAHIALCFNFADRWMNTAREISLTKDQKFDVNNDFGVISRSASDLPALNSARATGNLSRETYLNELKRRGTLSNSLDVEDEIDRIEEEGPPLGMILETPPEKDADPNADED